MLHAVLACDPGNYHFVSTDIPVEDSPKMHDCNYRAKRRKLGCMFDGGALNGIYNGGIPCSGEVSI